MDPRAFRFRFNLTVEKGISSKCFLSLSIPSLAQSKGPCESMPTLNRLDSKTKSLQTQLHLELLLPRCACQFGGFQKITDQVVSTCSYPPMRRLSTENLLLNSSTIELHRRVCLTNRSIEIRLKIDRNAFEFHLKFAPETIPPLAIAKPSG